MILTKQYSPCWSHLPRGWPSQRPRRLLCPTQREAWRRLLGQCRRNAPPPLPSKKLLPAQPSLLFPTNEASLEPRSQISLLQLRALLQDEDARL